MQKDRVMARAYGDCPTEAVVWEARGGLIYLSNPRSIDRVDRGETHPLEYPREDVFAFDEELYGRLLSAHHENKNELSRLWELATRYSPEHVPVLRG